MTLEDIKQDIKDTLCNSTLWLSSFDIDNYMMSIGASSYFDGNTEEDFKDDPYPAWYFPMFDTWLALEKTEHTRYSITFGDVLEL